MVPQRYPEQGHGYLTEVLPTLWTKGEALLSLLSLLVITPVVAFYLLSDWDGS